MATKGYLPVQSDGTIKTPGDIPYAFGTGDAATMYPWSAFDPVSYFGALDETGLLTGVQGQVGYTPDAGAPGGPGIIIGGPAETTGWNLGVQKLAAFDPSSVSAALALGVIAFSQLELQAAGSGGAFGTESAPGLVFTSADGVSPDLTTGVYKTATGELRIAINGARAISFNSSQQTTLIAGSAATPALVFGTAGGNLYGIANAPALNTAALGVNGGLLFKSHTAFAGSDSNEGTGAVQTTNATQSTVATLGLDDNTVYWLEADVVGRDTSGTDRAAYKIAACAYRQGGGSATLQGSVTAVATAESNAAWDATFTVSGNSVRVSVTGAAATTINWATTIRWQGVSGNT